MNGHRGQVVTFYSYKGGVGRSMALSNVATLFAHLGKRVLAIDFDLEAPGLHRYFGVDDKLDSDRGGVIEFFHELKSRLDSLAREPVAVDETGAANEATSPEERLELRARAIVADLLDRGNYLRSVTVANPNDGSRAPLNLMVSGRFDSTYPERVRTFPWQGLYEEHPYFVEALTDELTDRFDYILLDSRTGTTDVGSLCTVLLPEKLVLVSTPNEQSLHGATEVGRQAVELRKASPDLRPLPLFPLMSRVENAEDALQRQWINEARRRYEEVFREAYGLTRDLSVYFDAIQIPHRSFYAYGEIIAAERERLTEARSLVAAFREFAEALRCNNAVDAQTAIQARFVAPTTAQQRAVHAETQTKILAKKVVESERRENVLNEQLAHLRNDSDAPDAHSVDAPSPVARGRSLAFALIAAAVALVGVFAALTVRHSSPKEATSAATSAPSVTPSPPMVEIPAPPAVSPDEEERRRLELAAAIERQAGASAVGKPPIRSNPPKAAATPTMAEGSKPPAFPPTADQAILAAIQPRASSAVLAGKLTSNRLQVYRFDVWIETAPDVAKTIASVDYFFDHPSFTTKHFSSKDSPNFRKYYEGWGCIENVAITVTFLDGKSHKIGFNQCGAL